MALISAFTLIRTLSLFHLTLAYYFLVSPGTLAEQSLVFLLGEAMHLPAARNLDKPTAPGSLLAMVLVLLGMNDLVAVSLPEEVARYYWGSQAPLRLLFFFCLPGYIYLARPGGLLAGSSTSFASGADGLTNGLVFTWVFVEMVSWFWIYTTIRDERKDAAIRIMNRRKAEDED
ncbi:MAG: hypothetical protein M1814_003163 [Vezdaea aestivalis]|nr:MAG: hypothetical protein M1814_003163 [Vezdaea aestivalis]